MEKQHRRTQVTNVGQTAGGPCTGFRLRVPRGVLQMDDLLSRLSMAKDKITDTKDLISIDLDHRSGSRSFFGLTMMPCEMVLK